MTSPAQMLRPGDRLASTVCGVQVVVVRGPAEGHPVIECGGGAMVPATSASTSASTATSPSPSGSGAAVTLVGKRYVNATGTVELLCVSSGAGELSCDGVPMTLKAAKPLPASD